MFAAGAVEAMTGSRPGDWSYTSDRDALRLAKAAGGFSAILDGLYLRRPVERLQRGDIGLMRDADREYLAVVWNELAISPGPTQSVHNLALSCSAGWAVD